MSWFTSFFQGIFCVLAALLAVSSLGITLQYLMRADVEKKLGIVRTAVLWILSIVFFLVCTTIAAHHIFNSSPTTAECPPDENVCSIPLHAIDAGLDSSDGCD
jgi:hypothetical protein